jgi:hypothetical protein
MAVILMSTLAFYMFQKQHSLKYPGFDDYKASENFSGKIAPVNYASDGKVADFKDKIEDQVKNGVNFAGHYILTVWSCGQNCRTGAVIDALSGSVYDLPVQSACALDFRKNSNLLILNADTNCPKDSDATKPRYFVFEGQN